DATGIHVCVVNADGSGFKQLTSAAGWQFEPTWSPDGTKIAYTTWPNQTSDIFVMNADGTGAHDVTNTPRAQDTQASWSSAGIAFAHFEGFGAQIWVMNANGTKKRPLTSTGSWNVHPTWSPDGKKIAYAAKRSGEDDVYVLDLRTHRERRVARAAESPSWSPDGRWIAYDGYGPDSIATDICLVRPDGKGRKQLTHTLSDNRAPAWSPDAT